MTAKTHRVGTPTAPAEEPADDWYEEFEQERAELTLQPPSVRKLLEVVYNV